MICDLHNVQDIPSGQISEQGDMGRKLHHFGNFTHFNQVFNSLLDCKWFWNKFACKLLRDLVYQVVMVHMLSVLHNSNDASLPGWLGNR